MSTTTTTILTETAESQQRLQPLEIYHVLHGRHLFIVIKNTAHFRNI